MRRVVSFILFLLSGTVISIASECPRNPNALGTSRVIVVDPVDHPRVGTLQYHETLPLNDHEVVLTFDDGPLAPYTNSYPRHACVKLRESGLFHRWTHGK